MDLFASAAALSRWDSEIQSAQRNGESAAQKNSAAEHFLRHDDKAVLAAADATLTNGPPPKTGNRLADFPLKIGRDGTENGL